MDENKNNKEANVVDEDALILSLDNIIDSWVLYSWASFHTTPHRKYFLNYVQGDVGQVYLGDDELHKFFGKGEIHMKLPNGNQWFLKEVRHVLDLRINLILVGQ